MSGTSRRRKLIALMIGLLPVLAVEIAFRAAGVGEDPVDLVSPGTPIFVRNGDRVELAPARRRQFRTRPFEAEKPAGLTRIAVVGDSGTYGYSMFDPERKVEGPVALPNPYPARLQAHLAEDRPDGRFEVLNCGGCGFGTGRLRDVVREVLAYDPDALVFMAGSSEFLEMRFFENWQRMRDAGLGILRHWRTLTVVRSLLRKAEASPEATREEGFDPNSPNLPVLLTDVIRDRSEVDRVVEHAAGNIEEIAGMCREAGVPLVLCTVPSHLRIAPRAFPGYAPEVEKRLLGGLDRGRIEAFNAALIRGSELVDAKDYREALEHLEAAAKEFADDPRAGGLHFLAGQALESLSEYERAREQFVLAKDLDVFVWRVPSALNEAIRRLSGEDGVVLADLELAFRRAVPDGIPDSRLFLDHNHPRPAGHEVIAKELERVLTEAEIVR